MTAITTTGLTHTYADGRTALRDISFNIASGESVAFIGPNGAGKTTLFLRLAGVLAGTIGQACVLGHDPADSAARKQMPRSVGVVFQNPDDQLFSPTLYEDVAFGPLNLDMDDVPRRVSGALETVGLAGYGDRVPHKLSGGEKRRAALATVLAMSPSVLLFDEPTMFLDPRGRRELIATLNALPGTKLIATHDLDFAVQTCNRAILLESGCVDADGLIDQVLGNETLMGTHGFEVPARLGITPRS